MLVNQNKIELKSTITDDWGGSYRIALDLAAISNAKDWKLEVSFPEDYKIDQIYGAKLSEEGGKTYISGVNWNKNLNPGETAKIALIIDEGSDTSNAPIMPNIAGAVDNSTSENTTLSSPISDLDVDTKVVEDWNGGYKLGIDVKAESNIQNWQVDFALPNAYNIKEIYGVDLIDRGNGNYTIEGQNDQGNLMAGQSIQPVFIIEDGGKAAIAPEMTLNSETVAEPVLSKKVNTTEPTAPITTPEESTNELEQPAQPEISNSTLYGRGSDIVARPEGNGRIINVDNEFGGNINRAISQANTGDVILLSDNTYYTDGLTLDKDITIDGQQGSIINGSGTSEAIISLTTAASGATIQDVEITNGNNGIYGYNVSNLTLQNLDINNIGIGQTTREGQYNTGIVLNGADGLRLINSDITNVSRKGVGVNDTDGAFISGLSVKEVNLAAKHAQSFDAAGVKFFNTNDVLLQDSYFSDINAFNIWNDTTSNTTIAGNEVYNVGEDFLKPDFNKNVNIAGIYNEKSYQSTVRGNKGTTVEEFSAFNATEFSTETMVFEDNDFSSYQLNTEDYWVNEKAERLIAITEDPEQADFKLFDDEYFAQANISPD